MTSQKKTYLYLFIATCLPIIFQVVMNSIYGFPVPTVNDEFAYLLGADTFSSGKVTNPTPLFSNFFDTVFVIMEPSYAPKYQPAQATFLAIGQLLGHPHYGVVLSLSLLSAATFWALSKTIGLNNALLAAVIISIKFGINDYWVRSYWGGSIFALGSMLALGSYLRSRASGQLTAATLFAIGCLLISLSRPFEGLFFMFGLSCCFAYDFYRKQICIPKFTNAFLPVLALAALTFALQGAYNYKITGNALEMPYKTHQAKYDYAPVLWFLPMLNPPGSLIEHIEHTHKVDELKTYTEVNKPTGFVDQSAYFLHRLYLILLLEFNILTIAIVLAVYLIKTSSIMNRLCFILLTSCVPAFMTTWLFPHYCSAIIVTFFALSMCSIHEFGRKLAFSATVQKLVYAVIFILYLAIALKLSHHMNFQENLPASKLREATISRLNKIPGRDLVFVRNSDHLVYNLSDIDTQEIIWANYISPEENQKLINYYADRKIWLIDMESNADSAMPYSN